MNPMAREPWPNRDAQLRRLLPHFRGMSPALDLGCGEGIFLDLLAGAGERGEGVERDAALVAAGRGRGRTIHEAGVAAFLGNVEPGAWGAILASHILEHLPREAVRGFFGGCAKGLRPGGRLVLLTPNPRNIGVITSTFWGDLDHVRPYAAGLLAKLSAGAGLAVVHAADDPYTRQPGWVHRPLTWVRRLLVGDYWPGADLLLIAEKIR
jgi:SAM-dependent methyltransferase